ncbi:hypothetical protein J437_LFUL004321 [Ladona fulva]|uniref:Uncharacterized protein n=1 Tax=Ladona fulva TaxID=123851 RepID=A0A8K0K4H9_LADFU|nr:hypothetical protein J437_LFUL004321 [Ladona fulva]
MNFPKNLRLCRLCLLHKDSYVNIHEQSERYGFVVADEISELLQLNISPGDGLPEGICYDCLYDLCRFKHFKKVSHEAELTLKYILSHDGETGQPRERPVDVMDCLTNGYGNQNAGSLSQSNDGHLGSPRRDEAHSYEGEVGDDADVALMCEATLSEVEETLPVEAGVVSSRKQIKMERGSNNSQQRRESSSTFSNVKVRRNVKNGANSHLKDTSLEINSVNAQNVFKCPDCLTVFNDEYSFRGHIASGECAPLYVCSICNESFMNNACLMEHNVNFHPEESQECDSKDPNLSINVGRGFVCEECGSCFRKKIVFEHHMVKHHARELSFKCMICWKSFLTKGGLKEHLVVHSTERPFVCEICGSAFKLRKKLLRHVRNCHSEK